MNYVDELWMSCAPYRQVYREVLQPWGRDSDARRNSSGLCRQFV